MSNARARLEPPDISEKGGIKGGQPQRSDERLFMQLFVFTGCDDVQAVVQGMSRAPVDSVVYEDLHDPRGVAILTIARDPNVFLDIVRPLLADGVAAGLQMKPDLTMVGRTYSLGYEPDLKSALIDRPRRTALNPDWRWAVWYPLRRNGRYAQLSAEEQRTILAEHGELGIRFGAADYAHDIRLACFGLDRDDNDFVIGLTGKELYPLSAIVQEMRRTQQTSLYLDRLGPFFVGRAVWQSPLDAADERQP
jgi:chlorite dismutase